MADIPHNYTCLWLLYKIPIFSSEHGSLTLISRVRKLQKRVRSNDSPSYTSENPIVIDGVHSFSYAVILLNKVGFREVLTRFRVNEDDLKKIRTDLKVKVDSVEINVD